jgi:hypothetical protein
LSSANAQAPRPPPTASHPHKTPSIQCLLFTDYSFSSRLSDTCAPRCRPREGGALLSSKPDRAQLKPPAAPAQYAPLLARAAAGLGAPGPFNSRRRAYLLGPARLAPPAPIRREPRR